MNRINYPRRKWSGALHHVIVHANSIGAGLGTSNPATKAYPALLAGLSTLSGTGVTVDNVSESGRSIVTLGTSPSTLTSTINLVVAQMHAGKKNLVIVHEFINEFNQNGNNVSTAMTGFFNYCTALRSAASTAGKGPIEIALMTAMVGRSQTATDTQINARNAATISANALLRQQFRGRVDYLWDMAREYPWAGIEAAGDLSAAVFAAINATLPIWTKNDGQPIDYIHFGDMGAGYLSRIVNRYLRRVRP